MMTNEPLSMQAARVWQLLDWMARSEDVAFPYRKTIAKRLSVSTRTVGRALDELVQRGAVRVKRTGRASLYYLIERPLTSHIRPLGSKKARVARSELLPEHVPSVSSRSVVSLGRKKSNNSEHAQAAPMLSSVPDGVEAEARQVVPSLTPAVLASLLAQHGADRIVQCLALLRSELNRRTLSNPAGWFVRSVRDNYAGQRIRRAQHQGQERESAERKKRNELDRRFAAETEREADRLALIDRNDAIEEENFRISQAISRLTPTEWKTTMGQAFIQCHRDYPGRADQLIRSLVDSKDWTKRPWRTIFVDVLRLKAPEKPLMGGSSGFLPIEK